MIIKFFCQNCNFSWDSDMFIPCEKCGSDKQEIRTLTDNEWAELHNIEYEEDESPK